jgi:transcriptional regulator of arginine metabolism
MAFKDVLGCIAGDDTIMVAVRTVDACLEVMKKIRDIVDD